MQKKTIKKNQRGSGVKNSGEKKIKKKGKWVKGKEKRLREIEGTLGKGNKEKEKWAKGKEEGGI